MCVCVCVCTHIPYCDPWRAGGVNRRPPPSAATDCPRPSSIPILEQHSRPSFLPRPPLLYPAAAKASSLSYRFQRPYRPEERTETEQNVAVLWINLSYIDSKRGGPIDDPVSIGSRVLRGMFLPRMTEWRINRHSIGRRFHQKAKSETAGLSSSPSANLHRARNIWRRVVSTRVYISSVYPSESTRS